MGSLIYMFAAYASRCNKGKTCLEGMSRLAATLHPHGVKITWLVSPESARIAARELTDWHETHGDDIAVDIPRLRGTLHERIDQLSETRSQVAKALPWTRASIAAGLHDDPQLGPVLDGAGFEGIWGFCWEQIEVDQITDRGCPWGFYYLDEKERLRPAAGQGPVAMEWTARDLLKSFHSGNPCLYSTDPNDVARGGLCSWEDIAYWEGLADNYVRNTRYNEHVFLVHHQEAHEMERSDVARCYTEEDIREAAVMLDRFAAYLKDRVTMLTLAEAAALYRKKYSHTPSSYMLWEDTPTRPHNSDYAWSTCPGPWPKTLLYCDRGAQMTFVNGQVEPACIRNYGRPWTGGSYFAEPVVPRAKLISNTQHTWNRTLEITVTSPADMPYGLALWGDFSLYQIAEAPDLVEGKILSRELLFLRYDIKAGENRLAVKLTGK